MSTVFKKEKEKERMGQERQEENFRHGGRSCAACAGESSTPAIPISSWRGGRCARTAWDGTPDGILPPSCAGWAAEQGILTLFDTKEYKKGP